MDECGDFGCEALLVRTSKKTLEARSRTDPVVVACTTTDFLLRDGLSRVADCKQAKSKQSILCLLGSFVLLLSEALA